MINPVIKYLPSDSYEIKRLSFDEIEKKWNEEYDVNFFDVTFYSTISCRTSFYISHGIADKLYREASMINKFDYIGVSGELWVEKLTKQGMSSDRIIIIGYPKLDDIYNNKKEKIKNKEEKINVLYAPTHNFTLNNAPTPSSYPLLLNETQDFENLFNFKVSAHPANKENHEPTINELEWADVVISDSGSLLYEAWALDIPVIFPDWIVKDNVCCIFKNSFEHQIYVDKIGYHALDINHMKDLINKAYINGMDSKSIDFMEGIFPRSLRGKSGEKTANVLLDFARR